MTFHYFAYGSNMLPARLSDRCRSAVVVGKGIARDFALEFSKPSNDGSGKATLVNAQGATVPGVVFAIEVTERDALDRHEGLGSGYCRDDNFIIELAESNVRFSTSTYLATTIEHHLMPYDWYLAVVIAGAICNQIGDPHLATLRNTEFIEDLDLDRDTRRDTINAMRAHGIVDYQSLLKMRV